MNNDIPEEETTVEGGTHLEQLGRRVRAARLRKEMSQTDLGRAIGLSKSSLANIEAGRQDIPATRLVVLANTLDTTVGALCGDDSPATLPRVRVVTTAEVDCEEHGVIWTGEDIDKAHTIRKSHIREHMRGPGDRRWR